MQPFAAIPPLKQVEDDRMATLRTPMNKPSNLDELEKLASLRERQIVSDEEFQAKKKQLLGV